MAKRPKRYRPVDGREVRAFLGKAEEYLETARDALGQLRMTAATGNAVHAGTSACDAICGARLGQRAAGDAHTDAVELLASIPNDGPAASRALQRLLAKKRRAEYDPDPISATDAREAVHRAEEIASVARPVVAARFGDEAR